MCLGLECCSTHKQFLVQTGTLFIALPRRDPHAQHAAASPPGNVCSVVVRLAVWELQCRPCGPTGDISNMQVHVAFPQPQWSLVLTKLTTSVL